MAIGITKVIGSTPVTSTSVQLLHERQHGVEFALDMGDFVVRYRYARQAGYLADGRQHRRTSFAFPAALPGRL